MIGDPSWTIEEILNDPSVTEISASLTFQFSRITLRRFVVSQRQREEFVSAAIREFTRILELHEWPGEWEVLWSASTA